MDGWPLKFDSEWYQFIVSTRKQKLTVFIQSTATSARQVWMLLRSEKPKDYKHLTRMIYSWRQTPSPHLISTQTVNNKTKAKDLRRILTVSNPVYSRTLKRCDYNHIWSLESTNKVTLEKQIVHESWPPAAPCVSGSDGTNDSSRVTVRPQASFLEMNIHSVPAICLSSSQELAELQRFGYDLDFKRSLSWLVNWEMALDVLRPQSFGRTGIVACLACQCKCSFGSLSCSNTTVKDVCVCLRVPPDEWHRALVSQRQVTTETCSFRTAMGDVCHQTFRISKHHGCVPSSPPLMSHWKHWPVVF